MDWIKLGVTLFLSIFIAEFFLGGLESARQAGDKGVKELPKPTTWAFRILVYILSLLLALAPLVVNTMALAVYVALGIVWALKSLDNTKKRESATAAMLMLCIPVSINIIWDIVLIIVDNGWNTEWKNLLWLLGPVISMLTLLLAGSSRSKEKEAPKEWVPQLVITVICIAAITGFSFFIVMNKEVMK